MKGHTTICLKIASDDTGNTLLCRVEKQIRSLMKQLLFLTLLFFSYTAGYGQQHLPGLWTGTLTQGSETYRVELMIIRDRQIITGRSYIYLPNGEVTQSEIYGRLHEDLSMNIYDRRVLYPEPEVRSDSLHFPRHFQLLYQRSFNDMELEGYWQDWHHSAGDPKRRQGRIKLLKKASKA